MTRVLVVGEINIDLILQNYHAFPSLGREVLVDDFVMTLGSASAIMATGLAKLGRPVSFRSRVGCDSWGERCLDTMTTAGVDVSEVIHDCAIKTGVTVSISAPSDRALVTFLGSITAMTPADAASLELSGFSHVHVSSYFLQEALRPAVPELFARATTAGLTTSLDTGFDPSERWDGLGPDVLRHVDVFFSNEVELRAVAGTSDVEAALRQLRHERTLTVVKLGAAGCAALEGERLRRVEPPSVTTVDTTGAGDSFNAGFLDAWLAGVPLTRSLEAAAFCGAMSTRGVGGSTTQATRAELDAHLRQLDGA